MRTLIFALTLAVLHCGSAAAQTVVESERVLPAFPTETFVMTFEGRTYEIDLHRVTQGEGPTTVHRVYVLQGEQYGGLLAALVRRSNTIDRSEGIIISIRRPDLAPDTGIGEARRPEFRGAEAEAFARFLVLALRPEIDRRLGVSTAGNIIVGEGDAAMFVLAMSISSPEAFDTFVAHGANFHGGGNYEVSPGNSDVYMSAERNMHQPMDEFEGLAGRLADQGRNVRVQTSEMEASFRDQISGLWSWIAPELIPPPL